MFLGGSFDERADDGGWDALVVIFSVLLAFPGLPTFALKGITVTTLVSRLLNSF